MRTRMRKRRDRTCTSEGQSLEARKPDLVSFDVKETSLNFIKLPQGFELRPISCWKFSGGFVAVLQVHLGLISIKDFHCSMHSLRAWRCARKES